ncbi:hypothetical protein [Thalassotalea fusca]
MKKLFLIIIKPLEWHIYLIAILCIVWLYLVIVLCPTFILTFVGALCLNFVFTDMSLETLYYLAAIGAVLGLIWAENIRRNMGILTFHSYLLSTPEIDGWRNKKGERIVRT